MDTLGQIYNKGYAAGVRGDDPRCCPYPPMTAEWKIWNQGNRWGAEVHRLNHGQSEDSK